MYQVRLVLTLVNDLVIKRKGLYNSSLYIVYPLFPDFDMTKEHVLRRNMQEESESKMSDDSGEENISSSANSVITRKEELQDETCRKNCLPQTDVIVSQSIPRYNNFSVSRLQHSQVICS